jgi:isoleucyl-tRNA synthetase
MRKLEDLRSAGSIGSSLQGEVDLTASGHDLALLQSVADQLPFIFIVSRVGVHAGNGELDITIAPSTHQKCERCWHWRDDIGQDPVHPHICGRCVDNLNEAGAG